jgi:hypothetical protein
MNDSILLSRPVQLRLTRAIIAGIWALGCSACDWLGDVPIQDLGNSNGGLGAPAEPLPPKELEQVDPGFAGHWVGYVENPFERGADGQAVATTFPSGSTQVTLDYRFEGEFDVPSGTLVFGAGPVPKPEPGVAYPPGVHHFFASGNPNGNLRVPVVEGFAYSLEERLYRFPDYDPGRTSMLLFEEHAAYADWCSVQVPLVHGEDEFDCLGADGFGSGFGPGGETCTAYRPDGSEDEVDCDFAAMCLSDLCSCSASGCEYRYNGQFVQVFLERQSDQITGTISGGLLESGYPGWYAPMGTLRLFRAD